MTAPGEATAEVTATLPDGRTVGGSVYRQVYGEKEVLSLWRPRTVWEFTPQIGETGVAGMDAALGALRGWLEQSLRPAEDTAVFVTWPSRDVGVSPALRAHGLVPTTALAVRPRGHEPGDRPDAGAKIRLARMADVPELVQIVAEEQRYSAQVLGATPRANAMPLLTASLKRSVYFDGRVFVAEADGVAVGAAVCGLINVMGQSHLAPLLTGGRWGYVGQFAVLPGSRGSGVGGQLAAEAHRVLDADAEEGTFLFYELANPLSSVFWPRQGYRPLWTRWICRPAGALL